MHIRRTVTRGHERYLPYNLGWLNINDIYIVPIIHIQVLPTLKLENRCSTWMMHCYSYLPMVNNFSILNSTWCSSQWAMFNKNSSWKLGAISWILMGRLSGDKLTGTETAGQPETENNMVFKIFTLVWFHFSTCKKIRQEGAHCTLLSCFLSYIPTVTMWAPHDFACYGTAGPEFAGHASWGQIKGFCDRSTVAKLQVKFELKKVLLINKGNIL